MSCSALSRRSFGLPQVRINDIFVFKHRALLVYPDDDKKPAVGQGFNRPAIVTLEQVFPGACAVALPSMTPQSHASRAVRKGTKERITKPEQVARYEQKLRVRPGLKFLSYDAHSGEWTFYGEPMGASRAGWSLTAFARDAVESFDLEREEDSVTQPGPTSPKSPESVTGTLGTSCVGAAACLHVAHVRAAADTPTSAAVSFKITSPSLTPIQKV